MALPDRSEETPGNDTDYAAIETAVMETARGRWFLAEYARRNRSADTEILLAEIRRLETVFKESRAGEPAPAATAPQALAAIIAETRKNVAEPDGGHRPFASFAEAGRAELSRMESAAERLHELAGTLRARDSAPDVSVEIERQANVVASATRAEATALGKLASIARALEEMERRLSPAPRAAKEAEEARPAPASSQPAASSKPARIDFSRLGFEQKMALFS